jgi:hypothetical protein
MGLRVKKGFAGFISQDVEFINKQNSLLMRFISLFYPAFMTNLWTTIGNKIYYPNTERSPLAIKNYAIIKHELIHVKQFKKYGVPLYLFLYLLCPLPFLFSYFRWKFEREAYLHANIQTEEDIDKVVNLLNKYYLYPWPKKWMRAWFIEQFHRRENGGNS